MAPRARPGSRRPLSAAATFAPDTVALLDSPRGPARASTYLPAGVPRALAVVLHGAGTGTAAGPLPELCAALAATSILAVRLDQPYLLAGRRAPDPAHLLDATMLAVLPAIRALAPAGVPLLFAGRSSGGRVACRVAAAADASAIACLGFPLQPPQGRAPTPKPSRAGELRAAGRHCPVLVVQGTRDPFGMPRRIRGVTVHRYDGAAHTPTRPMAGDAARWLAHVTLAHVTLAGNAVVTGRGTLRRSAAF